MRVEARIFEGTTAFFFLSALVYGLWAREPIGTTALLLSGGLTFIIGTYFAFVARRLQPRPEDRPEAEISDGAGELGFFSPGSYWPFGLGLAAALGGFAVAFWEPWLLVVAIIFILLAVCGLVFEYHVGPNTE